MGVQITINNLYDNGVCDEYNVLTGTTYNIGDATSMGIQSLPYTWDGGSYTGNLYVFVEHCDGHLNPPPSVDPKNQGGFQVRLLNIDCHQCPPNSTPIPTATPIEVDCNMGINVEEVFEPTATPQPTPGATPIPTATTIEVDCNMGINVEEVFEPTPLPTATPQPTPGATPIPTATPQPTPQPTPEATPQPTPSPTTDCTEMVITVEQLK